jgi:hypothetical protein
MRVRKGPYCNGGEKKSPLRAVIHQLDDEYDGLSKQEMEESDDGTLEIRSWTGVAFQTMDSQMKRVMPDPRP